MDPNKAPIDDKRILDFSKSEDHRETFRIIAIWIGYWGKDAMSNRTLIGITLYRLLGKKNQHDFDGLADSIELRFTENCHHTGHKNKLYNT